MGIYAVISDIHSNADALHAVEEDVWHITRAEHLPKPIFICLGDVVDYGPQPHDCVERLRRIKPSISLKGNHDDDVSKEGWQRPTRLPRNLWPMTLWTRHQLSQEQRAELRSRPQSVRCDNGMGSFYLFHSTPHNNDVYLDDPGNAAATFEFLATQRCRYGLFGHTHFQMLFVKEGTNVRPVFAHPEQGDAPTDQWCVNQWHTLPSRPVLLNPGSVGQPRCHSAQLHADARPAYLLLHIPEDQRGRFQWRRVTNEHYDPHRAADLLCKVRWSTLPQVIQPETGQDILHGDSPFRPGGEGQQLTEAELHEMPTKLKSQIQELAEALRLGK